MDDWVHQEMPPEVATEIMYQVERNDWLKKRGVTTKDRSNKGLREQVKDLFMFLRSEGGGEVSGQQVALALQVMGMDALAVAALSRKFEPSQAATARLVLDEFEHLMLRPEVSSNHLHLTVAETTMALRRRSILQAATEGEKRRNALLSRPLAETEGLRKAQSLPGCFTFHRTIVPASLKGASSAMRPIGGVTAGLRTSVSAAAAAAIAAVDGVVTVSVEEGGASSSEYGGFASSGPASSSSRGTAASSGASKPASRRGSNADGNSVGEAC